MASLLPYYFQTRTDNPQKVQNISGGDTFNPPTGQHSHNDRGTDPRDNKNKRNSPTSSCSFRHIARIRLEKPPHHHISSRDTYIQSNTGRQVHCSHRKLLQGEMGNIWDYHRRSKIPHWYNIGKYHYSWPPRIPGIIQKWIGRTPTHFHAKY